jgi:hypothetical protein
MGMFNLVNFEMNCVNCDTKVKEFQTKSGDCSLSTVNFATVDNFYAICPGCNSFIEFYYAPSKPKRTIKDYKMRIIQLKNERE